MADSSPSRRDRFLWAALLVAACAVVYANGVTGAFTYDDKAIVRDNPRIRSPRLIGEIFTTSYFGGPRGTGSAYRPILLLSYAVQWWAHGKNVVCFHIANIAVHAGATLLLAWLLLRIGISAAATLLTSFVFAVHPIHVEAVTSLVGRGEALTAVFVLLYLHAALSLWSGARWTILAAAMCFYAAALLTKESGAIAPALAFLLFAFVAEGRLGSRLWMAVKRGLALYAVSAIVLVAVFRLRAWVLGGSLRSSSSGIFEVENALAPLPSGARMANACVIFWRYFGRCLLPLHLSGDESAWSIRPLPAFSPVAVAAVMLVVSVALASAARLSARSPQALGFLFFSVALLPTGNLLFPIGTIFAERLAYLPSAGVCLVLGTLLSGRVANGFALSRWRLCVTLAVVLFFSARAVVRNAVWWTDDGLFANLVSTAPASAKAHYDVAYEAADERHYRKARQEYGRATAIYDGYWDAWAGKGRVEKEMGLLAEAQRSYEKSIAVNVSNENGYFGLGLVREALRNDAGAAMAYRHGIEHVPKSLPLAYRLALVSSRLGLSSAADDWNRALALGGDLCSVRSDHARWLLNRNRDEEARLDARRALRRDPKCAQAWRLLAQLAERSGHRLSRWLALEKAYHASRSAADLASLQEIVRKEPAYARRLRQDLRSVHD